MSMIGVIFGDYNVTLNGDFYVILIDNANDDVNDDVPLYGW